MKKIRRQDNLKTHNKILISLMLLILTLLFSVTAVSAEPGVIYVNNDTGNDTWDGQSPTWDGTSGPKLSIGNAVGTVTTGGTVNIANGIYKGTGNRGMTITKNMNIIGESQSGTVIDGEQQNKIFTISSGVTVTIQNLTITNGIATYNGAIYNTGNLTVTDCAFTGNTATDYGGAISNMGTLTVTGSTFNNNKANWSGGGAIYNDGTLTVTGSTFNNNTATTGYGGAIRSDDDLTVVGSTFTGNTASYGGAIYNFGGGTLTVTDSTFTENTANHGGAIYNTGTLTVTGSTFTENTAPNYGGGAIYSYHGTLAVSDSTFTENTAQYEGGAIYNNGGTVTVNGSTFTENTVTGSGGAITNYDGSLTVNDSAFIENSATGSDGLGSAIYSNSDLTITNCTFTENTARWGAIFNGSNMTVNNSTFTNNTAKGWSGNGGAIHNTGDANVNGSTFNNNKAIGTDELGTGGAIYNWGTLTVIGSNFIENTATDFGGAIYNYGGALTVTDSTFTENTAQNGGGAIYSYYGTLAVSDSTFTGNTVTTAGGAISNTGGTLTVTSSTFTNNSALNGGAIFNYGTGYVNFCRIVENTATNGKAIYNYGGNVDATNNWWGSNEPNFSSLIYGGSVTFDPWIVLTVTADPTTVNNGSTSQVAADLNHNSAGEDISSQGHVPDGIPIVFTATQGTINPASETLLDGSAASTFTANGAGTATVTATVDGQPVSVNIGITSAKLETQLTVPDQAGVKGGTVDLTATLTDVNYNPVVGREVTFKVNGSTVGTATTDSNGTATLQYTITQNKGNYDITATFAGDDGYLDSVGAGVLTVDPSAGLYLNLTVSNTNPAVGETFVITYKLGNYGPDNAENVTITFQVPEGLEFVGITVDSGVWTYDPSIRTVTWTLDNVPVGDPYLYLTVKALNSGQFIITPTIASDTYNWNSGDVPALVINVEASSEGDDDDPENTAKAATETVPMQKTGTPLIGIVLAILMVLGGLISTKKH
ncbi:MAG: right-handed parallel beta-helix repeat-containing protein [Methanobacterium sp.]|nr:right-handed parallel beta-helix repeat-containing protein [Methanobacterium sp.]